VLELELAVPVVVEVGRVTVPMAAKPELGTVELLTG
jgi:hypothetical protein